MSRIHKIAKMRELTAIAFIVVLFGIVGIMNPAFLQISNILLVLNGSVVPTILSIGIAFVLITGEIDVSIAATMGFTAAVCGSMIRDGHSWSSAIFTAIAIGILIGIINGFGVNLLRVPSIIMTLGTNGIIRGISYLYTNGKWVENVPFEFKQIAQKNIAGLSVFYLCTILVAIGIVILMRYTHRGRYFAAIGDNQAGATLVGIPVKFTKISAFVLSGLFAAAAGIIFVARTGFVTPTSGSGFEMSAIAACVLGGISLSGGVGSLVGAAFGAIIMSSISRLLVFTGISSDYSNTITGILLITIVVTDAMLQMHSKERARRERLTARISHGSANSGGEVS